MGCCAGSCGATAAHRQGNEGWRCTSGPRALRVWSRKSRDRGELGSDEDPQARGGHRERGTEVAGL